MYEFIASMISYLAGIIRLLCRSVLHPRLFRPLPMHSVCPTILVSAAGERSRGRGKRERRASNCRERGKRKRPSQSRLERERGRVNGSHGATLLSSGSRQLSRSGGQTLQGENNINTQRMAHSDLEKISHLSCFIVTFQYGTKKSFCSQ